MFIFDLLATIPIDEIVKAIIEDNSGNLKVIGMLKMMRILRVRKII